MNHVAKHEFHRLLAIHRQIGLIGNAFNMNTYGRISRHHDGPQRQQMRTDWRHHHGIHVRHHDRPVGGEVVSRRSRRSCNDNSICPELGHKLLVDLDHKVGHASDRSLGDDHIVQRIPLVQHLSIAA